MERQRYSLGDHAAAGAIAAEHAVSAHDPEGNPADTPILVLGLTSDTRH